MDRQELPSSYFARFKEIVNKSRGKILATITSTFFIEGFRTVPKAHIFEVKKFFLSIFFGVDEGTAMSGEPCWV
jgi:hypothetical protein